MFSYENLKRFALLLLMLRRKFPGRGYVAFARIGLVMIGLGLPGVLDLVISGAVGLGLMTQPPADDRLVVAQLALIACGAGVVLVTLWLYDRYLGRVPRGLENEGCFNLNIQPDTPLGPLVQKTAQSLGKVVDLSGIPDAYQHLPILSGPMFNDDFGGFLANIDRRTTPPGLLRWSEEAEVYRIWIEDPAGVSAGRG